MLYPLNLFFWSSLGINPHFQGKKIPDYKARRICHAKIKHITHLRYSYRKYTSE